MTEYTQVSGRFQQTIPAVALLGLGLWVGFTIEGDQAIGDVADDVLLVPEVAEELTPIVASVPLQLLAYHFADLKGTDVDQPLSEVRERFGITPELVLSAGRPAAPELAEIPAAA